ncbi:hypothetical protein ILUMI_20739 [Ignelater luminosus]|uniref:Peptidase S1 domain-containing protein n=1 Tax=Ignelater luminosus TaxID=2038154 RepID=A0A8K0CDT5_IGNLU|nr:hypothetical protein ILUMI_20739 [Ignelater luminosus]
MFRILLISALVALSMGAVPRGLPIRPMLDGRIVGGEDADIKDLPYQLSLQSDGWHICGASILSPTRAVTAAHCIYGASESTEFTVRAGSSFRGSGGQISKVLRIYQHPAYNPSNFDYDVAVLAIEELTFGTGVAAISLHKPNEELAVGTEGTISGWGTLSSGGSAADHLQVVKVPKVSDDYCQAAYGSITPRMTCHGYEEGGKDSCQGDSGGPNVANNELVGIVSWGRGCASAGYPGVYTKVADPEINEYITYHM